MWIFCSSQGSPVPKYNGVPLWRFVVISPFTTWWHTRTAPLHLPYTATWVGLIFLQILNNTQDKHRAWKVFFFKLASFCGGGKMREMSFWTKCRFAVQEFCVVLEWSYFLCMRANMWLWVYFWLFKRFDVEGCIFYPSVEKWHICHVGKSFVLCAFPQ